MTQAMMKVSSSIRSAMKVSSLFSRIRPVSVMPAKFSAIPVMGVFYIDKMHDQQQHPNPQ
jgi:hypothetical protein